MSLTDRKTTKFNLAAQAITEMNHEKHNTTFFLDKTMAIIDKAKSPRILEKKKEIKETKKADAKETKSWQKDRRNKLALKIIISP